MYLNNRQSLVTIVNGVQQNFQSLEVCYKQRAKNNFDLAIVDPPYGNIDAIGLIDNKKKGKQATKRTNYKLFENIAPDDEYYCELARVS